MNSKKYETLVASLNGIARKVFDAVPILEAANMRTVMAELARTGSTPDYRIVDGCIARLREMGLIREPARDRYVRVLPRQNSQSETETVKPSDPVEPGRGFEHYLKNNKKPVAESSSVTAISPKPKSAFERLELLGNVLRSAATECDDIALLLADEVAGMKAETDKLRQLQELLGSLGLGRAEPK